MPNHQRMMAIAGILLVCIQPVSAADPWALLPVPGAWEEVGGGPLRDADGFAWYRCFVKVPGEWKGQRLLLTAEEIDDVDEGFINGRPIGANGSMPPLFQPPSSKVRRPYVIDPDMVRYGQWNLIALRVYDAGGAGGLVKGPIRLMSAGHALELSGLWQFRLGDRAEWAQWPHAPGTAEAQQVVEEYLAAAGARGAGHTGIVELDEATKRATFLAAVERFKTYTHPNARVDDKGDPLPPEQALAALTPAPGLAIDLVAHEPQIAQPIHVTFDERGRMWVTQYRQFPFPAGLTIVSYDEHLRMVFDKIPPPPPGNVGPFRGHDRITLHEDTDGDGTFEQVKTFLDGLNITTAAARGRGGVWVLNPPYLLFYADADEDDVPDGDPVVHLSGFGLEDTHSVANSLTWGPDGWLYGGSGSTTTARIKVPLNPGHPVVAYLGQAIWRYHPARHVFEIFSEGGYNTFGVDFDDVGRVYSGTNGSPRGVHFIQDGFYQKSFGKHGPLTNPYAFGYLDAMPHTGDQTRLTHQFIIEGGGAFPQPYRGKMIAVNSLANWVGVTRLEPWGSTFKTVDEFKAITSSDRWFRPVHIAQGPDGFAYISDWYDARITHLDTVDNWDKERGRIYRLRPADAAAGYRTTDLSGRSSDELVDLLAHTNRWYRNTALRLIGDRQDRAIVPRLLEIVRTQADQQALESLWALYQLGAFTDELAMEFVDQPHEWVRAWAVRLIGDDRTEPPPAIVDRLVQLACKEPSVHVRSQLAATSKRLPGEGGLRIARALADREEDAADPYLPLQLWWAVEDKAVSQRRAVTILFAGSEAWQRTLVRETILPRLAERYAADPTEANQQSLALLLSQAPDDASRRPLIDRVARALEGRRLEALAPALAEALRGSGDYAAMPVSQVGLALRGGDRAALDYALSLASNEDEAAKARRLEILPLLGQLGGSESRAALLQAAGNSRWHSVRRAALRALGRFNEDALGAQIIAIYGNLPTDQDVRAAAIAVLASRTPWATAMLEAVAAGHINKSDVPAESVELLRQSPDASLSALTDRVFGKAARPTTEQKRQEVERLVKVLAGAPGDPGAGKTWFTALCSRCHSLHGSGLAIGPDLTVAKRDDARELLLSIVDPSAGVHEDFTAYSLTLIDGRQLVGFITQRQPNHLTLKEVTGALLTVSLPEIKDQRALSTSIMPENLLAALSEQQTRDLVAYLMSNPSR